jgi:hypothetical protein
MRQLGPSRVIGIVFDDHPIANRIFDIFGADLPLTQRLGVGKRNDVGSTLHALADDGQVLLKNVSPLHC